VLIYILLGEHIMSYLFGVFRNFDLKLNGKINEKGITSAPREKNLRILEIIIDLGISAYILYAMLS
jgi:hypothetical protein